MIGTRLAFVTLLAIASGPALSQDQVFRYTDSDGEEIFGPDYTPVIPPDRGATAFLGRPNAGMQVPDLFLSLPQSALRDLIDPGQLPAETFRREIPIEVPLRREFDTLARRNNRTLSNDTNLAPLATTASTNAPMFVHYVDVGQGAGAILEFPCGVVLVDTGGNYQGTDPDGGELFAAYLDQFFADRPQLNNTIDLVVTSHPHEDHLKGLGFLLDENGQLIRPIRAVVDNAQSGTEFSLGKQTTFRDAAIAAGAVYQGVILADQVGATGMTGAAIDPIECEGIDPRLTAFWGDAGIYTGEYDNANNHSVVFRVDYGAASFLFLGDIEDTGANDMLAEIEAANPGVFDVDVFQISHHGARLDTSDPLIAAVSPRIAVISMGTSESFGAKKYGHPRDNVIDLLQQDPEIVSDVVSPDREVLVTNGANKPFFPATLTQAIYGTGWTGTVIIKATPQGEYSVTTGQ